MNPDIVAFIINRIEVKQGMKHLDLVLDCITQFRFTPSSEILKTIGQVTEAGLLVEVAFATPSTPYEYKTFLLPQNTVLRIQHHGNTNPTEKRSSRRDGTQYANELPPAV
jgi:hypothetical protein